MNWTTEDLEYLKNNIGRFSIPAIAKHLNRTPVAVSIKIKRLGLGKTKEHVGMLTVGELAGLLKVDRTTIKGWIRQHGLEFSKRTTRNTRSFHFIDTEVFWNWAEKNREKIDFKKVEPNSIPPEPDWVKKVRSSSDFQRKNYKPWTVQEEKLLLSLLDNGLTYKEVSAKLDRTSHSVQKHYGRIKYKNL